MRVRRRLWLFVAFAVTALAGAPLRVEAAPDLVQLTPRAIANDLGKTVPSWKPDDAKYQVFTSSSPSNGRLLVFAPGQPDVPQEYTEFARRAAEKGYHALVLHYWNHKYDAPESLCDNLPLFPVSPVGGPLSISRESCSTHLFDGWFESYRALAPIHAQTDSGKLLNEEDALLLRLRRTLAYLDKHFPGQNWKKFAADHAAGFNKEPYIDWQNVTLAGHSSGSKLMAHVAQLHEVHSVLLLSGPNAYYTLGDGSTACPSAIAPAKATPKKRIYAYSSTNDGKYDYAKACHEALGFTEKDRYFIEAKKTFAPNGRHLIINSAEAKSSCKDGEESGHMSTAADCALQDPPSGQIAPTRQRTREIWDYLLTR